MASINQLISEIAHSVGQPYNVVTRRAIRLGIIHARNELIRKGFSNHNYVDKVLQQRFKLHLVDVVDGDIPEVVDAVKDTVKKTDVLVPRPVRLINNLPFHSVRTVGSKHPIEIAFAKEPVANYYKNLPGMECAITYDYINGYIYVNVHNNSTFNNLEYIVIEGVFEYPQEVVLENVNGIDDYNTDDDNVFLIPEDMISDIKKLVVAGMIPSKTAPDEE